MMALHVAQLAMWEGFALTLVYSCFCRASFTCKANTRRDIRWSFTFLGVVSLMCSLVPLWGYDPDGMALALIGSMAIVQITTAFHWREGVPQKFRKEQS